MPAPLPHHPASSPIQPARRSVTLPINLTPSRSNSKHRQSLGSENASKSPDASEHLIFSHSSVRIVQFTPPSTSVRPTSSPLSPDLDYPVDAIETLPWKSRMEIPVSSGSLKIEKIAGSAAFLKSGSVVHPMLKNSQCWCVDGNSIFVLRIRRLKYYRIELPNETPEDKELVEEFKTTLSKILRYEVTPCPFQRGFTVELPEEAKTPRRKKAWTPKQQPKDETFDVTPDVTLDATQDGDSDAKVQAMSDYGSVGDSTDGNSTDDSGSTLRGHFLDDTEYERSSSPVSLPVRMAPPAVATHRPSMNTLVARFQPLPESDDESDAELDTKSVSSSVDSFHSFQTSLSPLSGLSPSYSDPPSPSPQRGFSIPQSVPILSDKNHSREESDTTVAPESPAIASLDDTPKPQQEPARLAPLTIPQQWQPTRENTHRNRPVFSAPAINASIRNRVKESRKRDLSPLPPSSTLFNPSPKSPGNHLTASILQKTCTIVLGPPIHFIAALIQIAARIASGEDGSTYVGNLQGSSYMRDIGESDDPALSEDDFGLPLNMVGSYRSNTGSPDDGSDPWDLD
ncbi:hypothetical protein FQN54_002604 [Arachnomyces sp. PD_36]|nr:hypothetical protein FQN54_002604 [Arachnomyces sp. PD_36]